MHINILYGSGKPIYEQITEQIRGEILRGDLKEDEALPSIRTLAKELKVGVITAKRAYDDLCAEGFAYSVPAKGVFVAHVNRQKTDEYAVKEIEKTLDGLYAFAERNGVDKKQLAELIENSIKEFLEDK